MKNIFLTNAAADRDPVVQAAMQSILQQMTDSHDRHVSGIQPETCEVSPVNFLQDVLGSPEDLERREYERMGWAGSGGVWQ